MCKEEKTSEKVFQQVSEWAHHLKDGQNTQHTLNGYTYSLLVCVKFYGFSHLWFF